jgi:hypothetical protein
MRWDKPAQLAPHFKKAQKLVDKRYTDVLFVCHEDVIAIPERAQVHWWAPESLPAVLVIQLRGIYEAIYCSRCSAVVHYAFVWSNAGTDDERNIGRNRRGRIRRIDTGC